MNLDNDFYKYVIGNIQKNEVDIARLKLNKRKFEDDICSMYSEEYNQSLIKTLGDVVESLICAIYIDNNLDYEATKTVVLRFMEKYIEKFTSSESLLKSP